MKERNLCLTKHIPNRLQKGLSVFIYLFISIFLGRWTNFEVYVLPFGTDDGMDDNKRAR